MAEKITVPTLGESVTEATVSKWLKSQGEEVKVDEPIVELETDKVNVEVPSPTSGVLESITVKEGETVNVGSLLGVVDGSSKKIANNVEEANKYAPPKKQKEEEPQVYEKERTLKSKTVKVNKIKREDPKLKLEEEPLILDQLHEEKVFREEETKVSPAARKMANEAKLDLSRVVGS